MATKVDLAAIRDELTGKLLVGFETTSIKHDSGVVVEPADRAGSRPAKAGAVKVGKPVTGKRPG
jgi:hypothetical protein